MKELRFVLLGLALVLASPLLASGAAPRVPEGCDASVMGEKYWAVWTDDALDEIEADIEANRKADGVFAVGARPGTVVEVEQLRHEFRFGAMGFKINSFATDAENEKYEELFCRLFNQVTIPFYWRTFERYPGVDRFSSSEFGRSTEQHLEFARAHGMTVHGHPLCWGDEQYMTPFWLYSQFCPAEEKLFLRFPEKDPRKMVRPHCGEEWRRPYLARVRELFDNYSEAELAAEIPTYLANMGALMTNRIAWILDRAGDRVDSWDVVNESSGDWARNGRSCANGRPLTKSVYGILPPDYALAAFRAAGAHASAHPRLSINDWNIGDDYVAQIKDLAAHGARIDLVGTQFHLFENRDFEVLLNGGNYRGMATPKGIKSTFAKLGVGGRPVHLSEITIPAPGGSDKARQQQAIAVRNFYRAWFAQKSAWGITWWHSMDWWRPGDFGSRPHGGIENGAAGFLDADMNPKPVYHALDDLINREWRTRVRTQVEGEGEAGVVRFRGFRGTYRLSWRCAFCGKTHERIVRLTGDGASEALPAPRVLGCEKPVRDFVVDGKAVMLPCGETRLDLAKLYPGEVKKGKDGTRVAEVVFSLSAPADGEYEIRRFNDWFGEYFVNGERIGEINGPSDFPVRMKLRLRKGANEIRCRTRAGSGGKWQFGILVPRSTALVF